MGTVDAVEARGTSVAPGPARPRRGRRRARTALVVLVALAVLASAAYVGVGAWAWSTNTEANWCLDHIANTPAAYPARWSPDGPSLDEGRYRWEDVEDVTIPSRTEGIALRAWWSPPRPPETGVAILVHGRNSCRRDPVMLVRAGMLREEGFGVLVVDLRDHGDSSREDGHFGGGVDEWPDVLGAWDWLRGEGIAAERIGLVGVSMGTGPVMLAMADEPAVAAAFLDSPFGNMLAQLGAMAEDKGQGWALPGFILAARILGGDDYAGLSPDTRLVEARAGRPLFITHGLLDDTISPDRSRELAAMLAAAGPPVEPWFVEDARHVEAPFLVPDEYQRRLVGFLRESLSP